MSESRHNFVNSLVADASAHPVSRPFPIVWLLLLWWFGSWLFTLAVTLWNAPLRPGAIVDLVEHPRFGLETFVGLASGFLISALALRASIPGANQRRYIGIACVALLIWVGFYVVGLFSPALEFSMLGGRPGCDILTFVLGLPPLALGLYILSRGYVLHWGMAGVGMGLAAGCMPALLMQLACVYFPRHILSAHLAPALAVAAVGGLAGLAIHFWKLHFRNTRGDLIR